MSVKIQNLNDTTLNFDDKTFVELFEETRTLIPRYAPEWTDHNLSDPGITFMELLAWLAEMQIYYLNRITDENCLKFLKLLGEAPAPAQSARVDVRFWLSDPTKPAVTLLKGTQVAAADPVTGERIVFEIEEDVMVSSLELKRLHTREGMQWIDHTPFNEKTGVFYFPLGENPGKDNVFYLGLDAAAAFPGGETKLTIDVFDEESHVQSVQSSEQRRTISSAELEWEYWNGRNWRHLDVSDDTVALTRSGRVGFTAPDDIQKSNEPAEGEALYWIRTGIQAGGYEIPPRIDTILINTVTATHGRAVLDERTSSNGLPFQSIALRNKPVLAGTLELEIFEEDGEWHQWEEVSDFDSSLPDDRHFRIDLQEGVLRFGDGIYGRVPSAAEDEIDNVKVVRYRVGGGESGNVVQAGSITEIIDASTEGVEVENRRPATGGKPPELPADARNRVRRDFKKPTRTVTSADFQTLARETPGLRIARVAVLPQYHPDFPALSMPGAVTVVVVPETLTGQASWLPGPSQGFLLNVRNHLKSRSLLTTNLHVVGPELVEIKVIAEIRANPRMNSEIVKGDVEEALRSFLDPLKGGLDKKGWPFGRSVFKSEIYQVIENVEGIDCVEKVLISGKGCRGSTGDKITLRKIGLVYSAEHEIKIL